MLNVNVIRANPAVVKATLKKRQIPEKVKLVDDFLAFDKNWRAIKKEIDELRHKRNVISLEINKLIKTKQDASAKIKEVKALPDKIKQLESKSDFLKEKINYILLQLPNILDKSVPAGKSEKDNKVVKKSGRIKKSKFKLQVHGDLLEKLNQANFKQATKVSGSGFVFLKDNLALLDLALQRFAIDFLLKKKYTLIQPTLMLRKKPYSGVTDLAAFQDVLYKIENEDLYLIATSEHPLVSLYTETRINDKELPVKLIGVSPCFRKEIGSHGVDSRGLFRMHSFNKVEQVIICDPKDSKKYFNEIVSNSEALMKKLKLPYRVVNMCSADVGKTASKQFDIEAYFPREKEYKEVASISNCTDYQAVGLNIKDKKGNYLYTLNGTAIATSRIMRAIIENYQQKDSIKVPTVLQKYMNNIKKI